MKRALQIAGIVLLVLIVLLGIGAAAVYAATESRLNQTYAVSAPSLTIPTDAASLQEGERLFTVMGCVDCHADNGGGMTVLEDPAIGSIYGTNLTSGEGGIGNTYTTEDFARAILQGVRPDGHSLLLMPSNEYYFVSDEQIALIIGYVQTLAPIDNVQPPSTLGPLGRLLTFAGEGTFISAEHVLRDEPREVVVQPEANAEYGFYLARGCVGCHTADYGGGPSVVPGMPDAANITPHETLGIGAWSEEDFFRAMREGVRPDGSAIDPFMPWRNFARLTDTELRAIYLYLQTLPPVER